MELSWALSGNNEERSGTLLWDVRVAVLETRGLLCPILPSATSKIIVWLSDQPTKYVLLKIERPGESGHEASPSQGGPSGPLRPADE